MDMGTATMCTGMTLGQALGWHCDGHGDNHDGHWDGTSLATGMCATTSPKAGGRRWPCAPLSLCSVSPRVPGPQAKVEVAVAQELQLSEDTWAEEASSDDLQEGLATRVTGVRLCPLSPTPWRPGALQGAPLAPVGLPGCPTRCWGHQVVGSTGDVEGHWGGGWHPRGHWGGGHVPVPNGARAHSCCGRTWTEPPRSPPNSAWRWPTACWACWWPSCTGGHGDTGWRGTGVGTGGTWGDSRWARRGEEPGTGAGTRGRAGVGVGDTLGTGGTG